jgi:hypothetical protein
MVRTAAASGFAIFVLLVSNAWSLQMARVAVLPQHLWQGPGGIPVGARCLDADHDGLMELYGVDDEHADTVFGFEHLGGNIYQRFSPGVLAEGGIRICGDGDTDGLMELVTARSREGGGLDFSIFESPDSISYPRDSVWSVYSNDPWSASPKYCDLDRDHRMEIAVGREEEGITLFENSGDNSYDSVATLSCAPFGGFQGCDTGDIDGDARCELAASVGYYVFVFEATGQDNEYVLSAVCTLAVDTDYVEQVAAAGDMDQDGRGELVALSYLSDNSIVKVIESRGHGKFAVVWQHYMPSSGLSRITLSVGDVDGDGVNEFVFAAGGTVRLFKSTGLDEYELAWSLDSSTGACALFDVNRNGRAEVIFDQDWSTYQHCNIFEDTEGLAVAEMAKPKPESRVSVTPTVLRFGAVALFSDIPADAAVEIHGIDGRLVRRQPQVRQSSWSWDLRDQTGSLVPAGTYFAVVRSKGKATSLKLCVIR